MKDDEKQAIRLVSNGFTPQYVENVVRQSDREERPVSDLVPGWIARNVEFLSARWGIHERTMPSMA